MATPGTRYNPPPHTENLNGEPRKVGFELEFTDLSVEQTAQALQSALGGQINKTSVAEASVEVEGLGEIAIEVDWKFLKDKAGEVALEESELIEFLSRSAELVVPVEVVCPPVPVNELKRLDTVVSCLRQAGAIGTEDSFLSAYGVHVNTEAPALDASTIASYLRSFALLQWWLVDVYDVDLTRKISPYIDLYPEAYTEVLFEHQNPDMSRLIDDYLKHNNSRNRALDLLPLFAEVDPDRVFNAVDDDKIKSRPAFHYRLPDCHIEKTDWSLAKPWNSWCLVEQLADRTTEMISLYDKYSSLKRPLLGVNRSAWTEFLDQWLQDQQLV